MLNKSIGKEQTQWSYFLPLVLMAYRSSVHESTGFTPIPLVLGHKLLFPLDLMYLPPKTNKPTDVNKHVMRKQAFFYRVFDLVGRSTTSPQKWSNAFYNKKVQRPTHREGDYILLHKNVTALGKSAKFFSPWRSSYGSLRSINDVISKIREPSTRTQLIVHYHRMKPYNGQLPRLIGLPERQPVNSKVTTQPPSRPMIHDHCVVMFLPPPVSQPAAITPNTPTSSTHHSTLSSPAVSMTSRLFSSIPPYSSPDSFNVSTMPAESASPTYSYLLATSFISVL